MNVKLIGLVFVLADFAALTAYAVYHYGFLAFFDLHAASAINTNRADCARRIGQGLYHAPC